LHDVAPLKPAGLRQLLHFASNVNYLPNKCGRYGLSNMASTRGQRLRSARKRRFKSARAAALAMGIAVATYGSHERAQLPGGRDYGPDEARRYARRFGVTPEWLLTGGRQEEQEEDVEDPFENPFDIPFPPEQFEEPRTRRCPVMGYAGAGDAGHFYSVSQGYLDEIDEPDSLTDTTDIIELREHGLGPFFDRWLLFFGEMREPVTPDLLDYVCVAALDSGRMVVGKLRLGQTGGRYDVISDFGESFMDISIRWAAKVTTLLPP
jgi:hypothetical protein